LCKNWLGTIIKRIGSKNENSELSSVQKNEKKKTVTVKTKKHFMMTQRQIAATSIHGRTDFPEIKILYRNTHSLSKNKISFSIEIPILDYVHISLIKKADTLIETTEKGISPKYKLTKKPDLYIDEKNDVFTPIYTSLASDPILRQYQQELHDESTPITIDTTICSTHFQILRHNPTVLKINGINTTVHGLFSINPKRSMIVQYRDISRSIPFSVWTRFFLFWIFNLHFVHMIYLLYDENECVINHVSEFVNLDKELGGSDFEEIMSDLYRIENITLRSNEHWNGISEHAKEKFINLVNAPVAWVKKETKDVKEWVSSTLGTQSEN